MVGLGSLQRRPEVAAEERAYLEIQGYLRSKPLKYPNRVISIGLLSTLNLQVGSSGSADGAGLLRQTCGVWHHGMWGRVRVQGSGFSV